MATEVGEPSRAEIQQAVSALYDRAESDTGTFNATRARSNATRRPVGGGRGSGDATTDSVARQWFDMVRDNVGPTLAATLPADRMPERPALAARPPREERPAGGGGPRELEAGRRLELEAPARRTPELPGGSAAVAALPPAAPAALPAAPAPSRPPQMSTGQPGDTAEQSAYRAEAAAAWSGNPSPFPSPATTGTDPLTDTGGVPQLTGGGMPMPMPMPNSVPTAPTSDYLTQGGGFGTPSVALTAPMAVIPSPTQAQTPAPAPTQAPPAEYATPAGGVPAPTGGFTTVAAGYQGASGEYGALAAGIPTQPGGTDDMLGGGGPMLPEATLMSPGAASTAPTAEYLTQGTGFTTPVTDYAMAAPVPDYALPAMAAPVPDYAIPAPVADHAPSPMTAPVTDYAAPLTDTFAAPAPSTTPVPVPAPEFGGALPATGFPPSEFGYASPVVAAFLQSTAAPAPAPPLGRPDPLAMPVTEAGLPYLPYEYPAPQQTAAPAPAPAPMPAPAPAPTPPPAPAAPPAPTGATFSVGGTAYLGKADKALAFARAQIGRPCVWGATGPESYDPSGLNQAAWRAAGVSLPRATLDQAKDFPRVGLDELRPGDLVFFHDDLSHTGLVSGSGMMIHAPRPGAPISEEPIMAVGEGTLRGAVRPS
ncbi:C40 family peptidase [Streptomyces sp. Amel2xC10]|uniref:C40 family peptidase n=1 Tax=Streptomyces sp. Amel2xC10 TaxID=1305826 RepID=UPI000A085DF0|nr:NlpC/P60 family protein [Streptomyces sp. Amel2xC10]SME92001.1 Cell wall-associated hydrolase, NlpC family [Streptomyces sp. Amel2xC10]